MKIEQVMITPVITVEPETTVEQAWEQLKTWHCRHLPVVTSTGHLVGIVSDRDLGVALAVVKTTGGREPLVGEIMHVVVVTATPATPIGVAARQMSERRIGALPVLEGARVVGIVTQSDLLGLLARLLGLVEPAARLEADLQVEASFGEGVTAAFSG